jgi:hypothetical protein
MYRRVRNTVSACRKSQDRILGACPLCTQPLTLDRLAAALAGT